MIRLFAAIALASLLLPGCATQEEVLENQTEQDSMSNEQMGSDGVPTPIAGGGADANAIQDEMLSAQELLEQADSPLASRVIYFEYDSAKVSDESLGLIEAHGNFIASNGNVTVRLEGHADERGSREYNIALGDRRAQSVRRILLFQGASSDQIDTISYGEEQPASLGHDDSAWSLNRRVELVYEVK
jgi:peptidoglycan-associated lipoprotein